MKYIKAFLRVIGFIIIMISGFIGFILVLNEKTWWALPTFILWGISGVLYLNYSELKKCPTCKKRCNTTGIAGTEYKQYYCKSCKDTFWTTIFLQDYE